MKKYLNVIFALTLILAGILGYRSNRPRMLDQCFPGGTWEDVRVIYFQPVSGEHGENLDLPVTAEELKKSMGKIPVFRLFQKENRNCGVLSLRIFIDGEPVAAEILEDGSIAVENDRGGRTCWRAPDGELYQDLTKS